MSIQGAMWQRGRASLIHLKEWDDEKGQKKGLAGQVVSAAILKN